MDAAALAWAVLGVSVTGFFFLLGRLNHLNDQKIIQELKEIKQALTGDLDKPGIITRLHEHENEIKGIKQFCKETHAVPRNA